MTATASRWRTLAEPSGESQQRVALAAVERARREVERDAADERSHHVGHYLIGRGRTEFEKHLGVRPPLGRRIRRFGFAHATALYLGSVAVPTLLAALAAAAFALSRGATTAQAWAAVACWRCCPRSELAVVLAQRVAVTLVVPRRLPGSTCEPACPRARGRW